MKRRYVTFFDQERDMMCDLPWGNDNLMVVLATDIRRLEVARHHFVERQARVLLSNNRNPEEDLMTMRNLDYMVHSIGPKATTTEPQFPVLAKKPTEARVCNRRFIHLFREGMSNKYR